MADTLVAAHPLEARRAAFAALSDDLSSPEPPPHPEATT